MTLNQIPRWKVAIEQAIHHHSDQTVIQIATAENRGGITIPRVRSHIFRTFLDSPKNAGLPLLLSSTDVRTPKVRQLTENENAEVAWWIDPTKQQFRIISTIYIVPTPEHQLNKKFQDKLAKVNPGTSLSQFTEHNWEETRQTMFKSMSAHMKASWCRPTPGSPLVPGSTWPERIEEPDPSKEGYEEAKKNWDFALANFALVIIDPIEVDFVDLHVIPNQRSLFTKRQDNPGVWNEQELVP